MNDKSDISVFSVDKGAMLPSTATEPEESTTTGPVVTDAEIVELLGLSPVTYTNGDSPLHAGFADYATRERRRAEARALRRDLKRIRSIVLSPAMERRFWESSPVLTHIYRFAMARDADPWATLTVAIVEAIARIPPRWSFLPELGRRGSVNFIAGLIGISGASKGLNTDAGVCAFVWPKTLFEPQRRQPKSGAAFVKGYCRDKLTLLDEAKIYGRDDVVAALTSGAKNGNTAATAFASLNNTQNTGSTSVTSAAANTISLHTDTSAKYRQVWHNAVFDFAEVKDIEKGKGEIATSLIHMFSQERLGGDSMDDKYNGTVEPCRYTGAALIGIQPSNLDVLMKHAGTGLPQRCFLIDVSGKTGNKSFDEYVDFEGLTEDHGEIAPLLVSGIPGMTEQREWEIREEIMADRPQIGIVMPEHVAREARIELHGRRTFPEEYDPLDRHEGLIKMSVALALAYLHSFDGCGDELGFTEQHWRWAEVLMIKHRQARTEVIKVAQIQEDQQHIEEGEKQNLRDLARHGRSPDNVMKMIRSKVRICLAKGGDGRKDRPLPDGWLQFGTRTINDIHRPAIPVTLQNMKDTGEINDFAIDLHEKTDPNDPTERPKLKMIRIKPNKLRQNDEE